jgi:hypothetical protein
MRQRRKNMARWVDIPSYIGLDRRKQRPKLRFGERRSEKMLAEAPSLAAALRQLRVRALNANSAAGNQRFAERSDAIADLAEIANEPTLAQELRRLAQLLRSQPDRDWRAQLDDALATIADRFQAL